MLKIPNYRLVVYVFRSWCFSCTSVPLFLTSLPEDTKVKDFLGQQGLLCSPQPITYCKCQCNVEDH